MRISGWVVGAGLGVVMSCSSPSTSGLKSTSSGGGADGGPLPADGGGATGSATGGTAGSGATGGTAGSRATTSACVNSLDCTAGMVCDRARSLCVACVTAADCGTGQVCASDVCRDTCVSDKDCTSAGLLCDATAGHCVQCLTDGDCRSGGVCAGGQCTALGGTGGSAGAGGNGGSGGTTGSGGTSGAGGSTGSGGVGGVCQNGISPATRPPLDIVVLLDTSGSMNETVTGGTKWAVISGALTAFLQAPANAGLGVGLGYFPATVPGAPTTCTTDADCQTAQGNFGTCTGPILPTFGCLACTCSLADGCEAATYQTPEVPLALPPDHAPAVASIQGHSPGGGTPTRPALEGTLTYATSWAARNPGRKVAVVLATDGDPEGCTTNTVTDVANLAASALASPSQIETYVIGVGASLTSMNQVAAAGGTGQAYVIDTAADPGAAFQSAMNDIRARATPCNFVVPAGADLTRVNVQVTPGGSSTPTTVPHITGACGASGGWYYDAPGSITVCPTTCADVGTTGKVDLQLVCTSP